MNFMERLEEGLSEDALEVTNHLRLSQYQKNNGPQSQSDDDSDEDTAETQAAAELNRRSSSIVMEDIQFSEEIKNEAQFLQA